MVTSNDACACCPSAIHRNSEFLPACDVVAVHTNKHNVQKKNDALAMCLMHVMHV